LVVLEAGVLVQEQLVIPAVQVEPPTQAVVVVLAETQILESLEVLVALAS
jgi:hypothetical protein